LIFYLVAGRGRKTGGARMKAEDVFALGLGFTAPWKLLGQNLDTNKHPFELRLEIGKYFFTDTPTLFDGSFRRKIT
jgi:hypothetical protein